MAKHRNCRGCCAALLKRLQWNSEQISGKQQTRNHIQLGFEGIVKHHPHSESQVETENPIQVSEEASKMHRQSQSQPTISKM
jgi:hypothetical protein